MSEPFIVYELACDQYCYTVCATPGERQRIVHADPAINFAVGKRLEWLLSRFSEGKLKMLRVEDSPVSIPAGDTGP